MLNQIKQILKEGYIPGKQKEQIGILQAFYKRHTGRTMSGCSCRKKELMIAVRNILIRKGEL